MQNKTENIFLNTLYTPYTLDTYQTFTMENEEDYIVDDYREQTGNKEISYDDIEWTHDKAGYIKDLANNLIYLLNNHIKDDVIHSVALDGVPRSPREYNFITDNVDLIFAVDIEKLDTYIKDNAEDYSKNKIKDGPGFMWFGDDYQTKLNYYLAVESAKKLSSEEYTSYQFEQVSAFDHIKHELINK